MKLRLQSGDGENLTTIFYNISKLLNLGLSSSKIAEIEKYSNFPSLDALGTALDTAGLRNLSVGINSNQLLLAPTPSILHFNKDNGHFVILSETTDDNSYKIHDPSVGWYDLNAEDLNKLWSGTALIIEAPELTYRFYPWQRIWHSLSNKLMPITITAVLVMLSFYSQSYDRNFRTIVINILYISGLICSLYLVKVDMGDGEIDDVCKINKNFDCKSVLNSNGAKLFNTIKLSYLGAFYFLFLLLSWNLSLINNIHLYNLKYFAMISYSSLAFIAFSVSYQKFVVKSWCLFCLIVQGILLLSAISFYSLFDIRYSSFFLAAPIEILSCALAALAITYSVSLMCKSYIEIRKNKWRLQSLLFDTDLFKQSLLGNSSIDQHTLPKSVDSGHVDAPVTIIAIVDPFCESCYKAHKQINWMKKNTLDDFCVKTLFFTRHSKDPEHASLIAAKILALPKELQNEALKNWFDSRVIAEWLDLYGYGKIRNTQLLDEHNNWCESQDIQYTPSIYFNGSRIAKHYEVKDLHHHIITVNRETKYQNA